MGSAKNDSRFSSNTPLATWVASAGGGVVLDAGRAEENYCYGVQCSAVEDVFVPCTAVSVYGPVSRSSKNKTADGGAE